MSRASNALIPTWKALRGVFGRDRFIIEAELFVIGETERSWLT
jgi:hypothetical protein